MLTRKSPSTSLFICAAVVIVIVAVAAIADRWTRPPPQPRSGEAADDASLRRAMTFTRPTEPDK